MKNFRRHFKGKKITVMGLGLLGRGLGDAVFLAECGADLIVTDVKSAKELKPSLQKLKRFENITYHFGGHRLEDFRNRDFILKAAGVPLDSPYIAEARKQGIPVEMDASLFARIAPKEVTLVGVTGTRGKSTTTALIHQIVTSYKLQVTSSGRVFKGGNLVSEATLPLLKKVKSGDIVVLELDSWQLQGFGEARLSPHVAVFTNLTADHLNYYHGDMNAYFADKANIFRFQRPADYLICGAAVAERIQAARPQGKLVIARKENVPADWRIQLLGEHNRENIACAVAAARVLGVSDTVIKKAVERFKGIPGRLEYLRTVRGVRIYNDNNATTPVATIAALRALDGPKAPAALGQNQRTHIVLILGGTDKGLNMTELVEEIPKHCRAVVFLEETGTEKLISNFQFPISNHLSIFKERTLKACVAGAMKAAKAGDVVLFSPAFASFGRWFKNEYDRGKQFVEIIDRLR